MNEKEMNGMEADIIDFEDEEGNVIPFEVIDYLFYNGEEYALLVEVTEEDENEEKSGCKGSISGLGFIPLMAASLFVAIAKGKKRKN